MPTSAEPELLVDTSVAVALVVSDHEHHDAVSEALGDRRLGLAGQAAFETFSVLTRLPTPLRRTPRAVGQLLANNFSDSRFLDADAAAKLLVRLSVLGIAGGAVYDALVGAAALQHRLHLATRDRRAMDTYRKLDVDLEILS
ncbi:MAG: type II toxin-antitoxin system VapC family toxin [Actinomycetota bacterium]